VYGKVLTVIDNELVIEEMSHSTLMIIEKQSGWNAYPYLIIIISILAIPSF
jgi:hypothetical protein